MMASDLFVSVIAPVRDDADILEAYVEETTAMLRAAYTHYELLIVDDGSTDDTPRVIDALLTRHEAVRFIRLSRSFGEEIAISAGLDSAIGDYVVVMLPDSDPPALVPQMVEQSRRGTGIVFGIRKNRAVEPLLLRLGAALFYWGCNKLLGLNIPKNSTHFRVLSRQAVNAVVRIGDRNRYLRTLSAYVGYSHQSVEYDQLARRAHRRTKSFAQGVRLALGILVSNSLQPLYLAVALGLIMVVANGLFMTYVVAIYLFKRDVAEGWTTQSFMLGAMFGSLALLCTVVAAYLSRLLGENQDRPLYFVHEERQSAVPAAAADRMNVVTDPVRR